MLKLIRVQISLARKRFDDKFNACCATEKIFLKVTTKLNFYDNENNIIRRKATRNVLFYFEPVKHNLNDFKTNGKSSLTFES